MGFSHGASLHPAFIQLNVFLHLFHIVLGSCKNGFMHAQISRVRVGVNALRNT